MIEKWRWQVLQEERRTCCQGISRTRRMVMFSSTVSRLQGASLRHLMRTTSSSSEVDLVVTWPPSRPPSLVSRPRASRSVGPSAARALTSDASPLRFVCSAILVFFFSFSLSLRYDFYCNYYNCVERID